MTKRRVFAAVAGLGLVASALPAAAGATSTDITASGEQEKVSGAVASAVADGGTADVWFQLSSAPELSAASSMSWEERGQYVYDSLRANAEESQAELLADLDAQGVEYEAFWINNAVFVKDADADLVAQAAATSEVARVTPDFEPAVIDPAQESPTPSPQAIQNWGLESIKAPQIWEEYDQRGEGIVVGTFDTGIEAGHPGLVNAYRGTETGSDDYNWFDSRPAAEASPTPVDPNGHGTHVTGIMVGDDGGENQTGVAPEAQFIGGVACCVGSNDLVASMQWFLAPTPVGSDEGDPAQRPQIINNSWGFPGLQAPGDDPTYGVIFDGMDAWTEAGIFHTWASGNSGPTGCDTVSSPAWNDAATYVVGNHQEDGSLYNDPLFGSSRGPGEDTEPGVDIGAPGTEIVSTYLDGTYVSLTGTSMAAPHVAGAVALLWAEFPDLQGDIPATQALLDEAAVDQEDPTCGGEPANNQSWGEGKLDLVALFEAAGGDDPEPPTAEVQRIEGGDRWLTAAQVAAQFPEGVGTVYIANAEATFDGADALAAGAVGAKGALQFVPNATPDGEPAPILMTKSAELPSATADALADLGPANIVILGGDTVVSDAVEAELVETGADVTRVEGTDRYETAAALAAQYEPGLETVFVATGQGDTEAGNGLALADALTAASLAGSQGAPVLLTRTEGLPAATVAALEELAPQQIVLVGGTEAAEQQVEDALNAIAPTERLAGDDRYETAALMLAGYPADGDVLYVASGQNFPDALAGSSLTGSQAAPLIVVNHKVPEQVAAIITELSPQGITILGGPGAVSTDVEAELQAILDQTSVD